MTQKRVAVYPASFDPITNGHLDIIDRAAKVFDELIVAVGINVEKPGTFTHEERLEILREVLDGRPNVSIDSFSGLLVDFLRQKQSRFARQVARLNQRAEQMGYEVTLGDAYRDARLHGQKPEVRIQKSGIRTTVRIASYKLQVRRYPPVACIMHPAYIGRSGFKPRMYRLSCILYHVTSIQSRRTCHESRANIHFSGKQVWKVI